MKNIGNIVFDDIPLCLSPMAGVSSLPKRIICNEQGATYCPTELVSARSIVYNGIEKSFRYMMIDPEREGITCIQLFGNDPSDFDHAIRAICEDPRLHEVSIIDINMGCPVPKVVKTGAGSALMREPETASAIVKASKAAASSYGKPVTVKTRIGWDEKDKSGPEFAKVLAQAGADAICVHGRTRVQMYGGNADREAVAKMREACKGTFFFANGDITDGKSAEEMLRITGADGLMVGRAAIGDPFIFGRIRAFLGGNDIVMPSLAERCDMLIRELTESARIKGEITAVKEMRSVMPHYVKGIRGAASVKAELVRASGIEEVKGILDKWLKDSD